MKEKFNQETGFSFNDTCYRGKSALMEDIETGIGQGETNLDERERER